MYMHCAAATLPYEMSYDKRDLVLWQKRPGTMTKKMPSIIIVLTMKLIRMKEKSNHSQHAQHPHRPTPVCELVRLNIRICTFMYLFCTRVPPLPHRCGIPTAGTGSSNLPRSVAPRPSPPRFPSTKGWVRAKSPLFARSFSV